MERQRRRELAATVGCAVRKRTELSNGYALTLDAQKITGAVVNEWITLEQRCCPFLNFQVRASDQTLTVELTGSAGVKEFLRTELSR